MKRRWRWLLRIVGLVLFAAFVIVGDRIYLHARTWNEFNTRKDHIKGMIMDLSKYPPPDASEHHWLNLCHEVVAARGNALFSLSHVSIEEVRRLEADVQQRLAGETQPDLETLDWIWNRIGECGSKPNQYITYRRPAFDEWADAAFANRRRRQGKPLRPTFENDAPDDPGVLTPSTEE